MAWNYPETIPEEYKGNAKLTDAYKRGWRHGHGFACHNVPKLGDRIDLTVDYVGLGRIVTEENIREYHALLCFAAEEHSRSYSPFEFTAHEFNSAEDEGESEALWEAFEAGAYDAIRVDLAEYTDQDYGIRIAIDK